MEEAYEVTIDMPNLEDAQALLDYSKQVGAQTEFLSFGEEGIDWSVQQEELYIQSLYEQENQLLLVAKIEDTIIAVGSIASSTKEKFKHIGELGISVLQEYWGQGLGSHLMSELLFWAKTHSSLKRLQLDVASQNYPAIALYEKFGFKREATFKQAMKLKAGYCDIIHMVLFLERKS